MAIRRKHQLAAAAVAALAIALVVWWRSGGSHRAGDGGNGGGRSDVAAGSDDPWGGSGIKKPIHGVTADDDPTIASTGAPAVVEGVVRDAATHAPVAGAEVAFWSKRGELTTESGGDGHYKLDLTTGAWSARAASGDDYLSKAHVVRVDAPHVVVDLEVEKLAHVHGVVRDGLTHAATGGVEVSYESADKSTREALEATVGRATLTAGDGTYRLAVPPGEVRLSATASGKLGHRVVPAVAPGADVVADLEIRAMVAIDGRVVDGKGAGVTGAIVTVFVAVIDIDLNDKRTVTTGAGGRFEAKGLAPGVLTLDARTDDGSATQPKMFDISGGDLHDVVLTMSPAVAVRGHVRYADGRPAHGAMIKVRRSYVAGTFAETTTDSDGSFQVRGPADSKYDVTATNEYGSARQLDAPADAPIELVIHVPGGLRGFVHTKAGPVTDYTVTIDHMVPAGNDRDLTAPAPQRYTATDGKFEWPKLEPGTYDLTVRASGAAAAGVRGVAVPDGAWADIDVALDAAAALSGKVHAGDKPIASARVDAACSGASAITAADGTFAFTDAPAGDCAVTIVAEGYASAQRRAHSGTPLDVDLAPAGATAKTDLTGVGILLQPWKGSARVASVLSSAAGALRVGDVIEKVDGTDAAQLGFSGLIARIRGDAGTKVKLTIKRGSDELEIELTRGHVTYNGNDPGVA